MNECRAFLAVHFLTINRNWIFPRREFLFGMLLCCAREEPVGTGGGGPCVDRKEAHALNENMTGNLKDLSKRNLPDCSLSIRYMRATEIVCFISLFARFRILFRQKKNKSGEIRRWLFFHRLLMGPRFFYLFFCILMLLQQMSERIFREQKSELRSQESKKKNV